MVCVCSSGVTAVDSVRVETRVLFDRMVRGSDHPLPPRPLAQPLVLVLLLKATAAAGEAAK